MVEPIFLNINISTWASIFVALATLSLAFITYKTIKLNKKQMRFIQKQNLLSITNQNPVIQVEDFKIKENSLNLKIKNVGEGSAHEIGIKTEFFLVKADVKEIYKEKNLMLASFSTEHGFLNYLIENKVCKIVENGAVNYIQELNNKVIILKPDEIREIKLAPKYLIKYKTKTSGWRTLDLFDLIKLFKDNNRNFIGLSFWIVYKNSIEDFQDPIKLVRFVFDINNHKKLEESLKKPYPLTDLVSLSHKELETKIGIIPYEEYKQMKSIKNYIPEDEKESL